MNARLGRAPHTLAECLGSPRLQAWWWSWFSPTFEVTGHFLTWGSLAQRLRVALIRLVEDPFPNLLLPSRKKQPFNYSPS